MLLGRCGSAAASSPLHAHMQSTQYYHHAKASGAHGNLSLTRKKSVTFKVLPRSQFHSQKQPNPRGAKKDIPELPSQQGDPAMHTFI